MASIRVRTRRGGSQSWAVLYVIDGRQTSVTFDTEADAQKFRTLVDTVGPRRAMDAWGIADTPKAPPRRGPTLVDWVRAHVDQLTGVGQKSLDDYARYIRVDIEPHFAELPLAELREEDIAAWVRWLQSRGNRSKTIRNKHGFLSSALARAVPEHLAANPAAGRRLPRDTDPDEMRMLTRAEFDRLLDATTEHWRPLIEFLVVSGCRWGEAVALRPADVDRDSGTVRIRRAWTYSSGGYQLGPTKTVRSRRDIRVPAAVLEQLDYSGEWLFVNRDGGPVRYVGFRQRVWDKAVARAGLDPAPTPHDLRHTCASWMLNGGVPISVVSRHLGHESISTTVDVYGDVDQASAQLAADFMARTLRESK